jgi:hypothetical protein
MRTNEKKKQPQRHQGTKKHKEKNIFFNLSLRVPLCNFVAKKRCALCG